MAVNLFFFAHQPLQKAEILLIAVGREIEVAGNANKPLFFNRLFMLFHERLIGPPRDASRLDRVSFRPYRDLMGMEIVKAKLVEQRLFDNLVREQERFDPDRLQQPASSL